ncbi:beta-eliminating lyase-related protein [Paraliomyxa miuraensis]|nr:beta-eliminating lyase-related protein [Paraliomyxa miuraensis]
MPAPFDLRSDTVTRPTADMRAVMAAAEVGDDCYGDDPSVRALEAAVAERLGKPAAVFLPSGTMSNQIAVRVRCRAGDAIAAHPGAHVRIHENASAAAISGAQIMPIGDRRGYGVDELAALCHEESCGWPPVRLVWLEDTLGDAGGMPWPLRDPSAGGRGLLEVGTWARAHGRATHLDGARLWNAHVATGTPLAELAACADSVSVSLSKGLGAPVGSVLCGDEAFVAEARLHKHALGGGFRQSGIVAAAGLFALRHHVERLAEDHARARRLADAIRPLPDWEVPEPSTNLIVAPVRAPWDHAEQLCAPLRAAGVLCHPNTYREVRFALHLGIDDADLDAIVTIIRRVVSELRPSS